MGPPVLHQGALLDAMQHSCGPLQLSVMASCGLAQEKRRGAWLWRCRKVRSDAEMCHNAALARAMGDLEHPLLAGSASEEAPTADGVQEQPAATGGWWQRLFTAAATDEPPPEDASAWLHAHEVANRPGGPAAAAVANLSNTSAWESSTAKATASLSCASLTHLLACFATVIGAGIMALPKVFKVLGILPASALLFTVYALTHLSINLLLRCAPKSTSKLVFMLFLTRGAPHPTARRSPAAACPSGRSLPRPWASRGC